MVSAKRTPDSPDPASKTKKQKTGVNQAQAFEPTIAFVKPSRRTTKSIKYNDDSEGDERLSSSVEPNRLFQKQRKPESKTDFFVGEDEAASSLEADGDDEHEEGIASLPTTHMSNGSTVIVGGGIVGLCIAFELARKCRATKTRHGITVVEIRSDLCSLSTASGNCAGILSALHIDKKFQPLIAHAEEAWQDLEGIFELNGGNAYVDFKRDNVLGVYTHKGQGRNKRPTWYYGNSMDIFDAEESQIGKIDTQKFARWLELQCKKLGVRFVFNHHLASVSTDFENALKQVCLMSVTSEGSTSTASTGEGDVQYLDCQNLVLAAGPWTTGILQDVLFEDDVGLTNTIRTAYAYVVGIEMATKAEKDDVGLLLPFVAQDDKYIQASIGIAARVPKTQVTIFGTSKQTEDTNLPADDALDPSLDSAKPFGRIREYAGRRLDSTGGDDRDFFETEGVRSRYAKVSTSADGLPFVGRLPTSGSGSVDSAGQHNRPDGIWLCFGFGMYGTFLGPGVANALVSQLFNNSTLDKDAI